MSMKRFFGMLKRMFKILFKKVDIPLCYMLDFVRTYIVLYNMCIVNLNDFNMAWALKLKSKI
jgi:hypothetical protein